MKDREFLLIRTKALNQNQNQNVLNTFKEVNFPLPALIDQLQIQKQKNKFYEDHLNSPRIQLEQQNGITTEKLRCETKISEGGMQLSQGLQKKQIIETKPQLIQKTVQKNELAQTGKLLIPLSSLEQKGIIPKYFRKQQNDQRNKSIVYLSNIFKKNLLKQMNAQSLNNLIQNDENSSCFTMKQDFPLNEYQNSSQYNFKKGIDYNGYVSSLIQRQQPNSFEEEFVKTDKTQTSFRIPRDLPINQFTQNFTQNQQQKYVDQKQQNIKHLITEYFTKNSHQQSQLKNYDKNSIIQNSNDNGNTNNQNIINIQNQENSKQNDDSDDFQDENKNECINQMLKRKLKHISLEKYDSSKLENELRQKNNLQVQFNENLRKKISLDLQSAINHQQTQKKKNFKIQRDNFCLNSNKAYIQRDEGDKQQSDEQNLNQSKTLIELPYLQNFNQNLNKNYQVISNITSWDGDFTNECKLKNLTLSSRKNSEYMATQTNDQYYLKDDMYDLAQRVNTEKRKKNQIFSNQNSTTNFEKGFGQKINKHLRGNVSLDNQLILNNNMNKNTTNENQLPSQGLIQRFHIFSLIEQQQQDKSMKNIHKMNQTARPFVNHKMKSQSNNLISTNKYFQNQIEYNEQTKKQQSNFNKDPQFLINQKKFKTYEEDQLDETYDLENYVNEQRHIK